MFDQVEAFHQPGTVGEALRLLERGKGRARIVAGATDVAVERDPSIRILVDITRAGLSYIRRQGTGWVIGATTTMAEVEGSAGMRGLAGGLLCRAAAACGSLQNRNRATVGGNIANGSPAAELPTALLALDATVVVEDLKGRREIPLAGYRAASRGNGRGRALLVEVRIPRPPGGARTGWAFQKFGRTALDISVVNASAGLRLDAKGRVNWVRIALGAVAPATMRAQAAEAAMAGRPLDRARVAEAGDAVAAEVRPITDVRASAAFRREISRVLAMRALEECALQAGCRL
jgi:CO/xanthine dehydrogenase FAD-binding subunit